MVGAQNSDGISYPSISTIARSDDDRSRHALPSAPPVDNWGNQSNPMTPGKGETTELLGPAVTVSFTSQHSQKHGTGSVAWGNTQYREFQSRPGDEEGGSVPRSGALPLAEKSCQSTTLRTQLRILRWVGMAFAGFQIVAAAAVPVATYILVTKPYTRFAIEDYVHWGISLTVGAWGMLALGSLRPVALSIHIVLGAMFAAALGAHNNAEFNQLEDRCSFIQVAYKQCSECACAALNQCTADDYAPNGSCPGCEAPTAGFCDSFAVDRNTILLAVTGPITVFIMAIPIIFSLIALLKVELASGLAVSNKVAHALASVNEQLSHLNAREDITLPLDMLLAFIREIESEGGAGMIQLGAQCRTALSRAGFNVPPREYDTDFGKKRPKETSINVVASPPSATASARSAHSVTRSHHSMSGQLSAKAPGNGPPSQPDLWRGAAASMPRAPQPAAMQFMPTGGLETSIYNTSQQTV